MNLERYRTIINRIEKNPSCWYQKMYHSNFGHCIAGHAQIDAGLAENVYRAFLDGRRWLKLTRKEAEWLFRASRTFPELKALAETGIFPEGYDK